MNGLKTVGGQELFLGLEIDTTLHVCFNSQLVDVCHSLIILCADDAAKNVISDEAVY